MKRNANHVAAVLVVTALAACSSSGGGGSGAAAPNGGACSVSGGGITYCISWSNLTASEESSVCPSESVSGGPTYTRISSCPTANVVGTCTYAYPSGATSYSYAEIYYSGDGTTCAVVKAYCSDAAAENGGTTTFSGNGC
jgi:hypothetical protein